MRGKVLATRIYNLQKQHLSNGPKFLTQNFIGKQFSKQLSGTIRDRSLVIQVKREVLAQITKICSLQAATFLGIQYAKVPSFSAPPETFYQHVKDTLTTIGPTLANVKSSKKTTTHNFQHNTPPSNTYCFDFIRALCN